MAVKKCTKCKIEKDLDTGFNKRTEGGYKSHCKECLSRYGASRYDADLSWKRHLKIRYNISAEEYYQMLEDQADGCSLCGRTEQEEGKHLAVDHDHSCCPGKKSCGMCVRGLLCVSCNRQLGQYENNPALFQVLIPKYLVGDI